MIVWSKQCRSVLNVLMWILDVLNYIYIQGAAEIVKHFKNLVTCFSARVSRSAVHTAVISITALRRLFPQRAISRFGDVPWPPRSPDLTAADFFLWGYVKKSVQYSPYRLTCTQRKYTGRNRQTFRRNTSSPYAHLHNSRAPVHWGWWPPKRHCT